MRKSFKTLITSGVIAMGLFSTLGIAAPTVQAATNDSTQQYQLPHAVKIETGNFYYQITKPIGYQTLEGISPLMLINPDGIIHNSKVRVTMSDGVQLLQYGTDNAYYVDASQVTNYSLLYTSK